MVQSDRLAGLFLVIMSVGMTAYLLDTCRAEAGYIRWAGSVYLPTGKNWLAIAFCTACTVFVSIYTTRHFRQSMQNKSIGFAATILSSLGLLALALEEKLEWKDSTYLPLWLATIPHKIIFPLSYLLPGLGLMAGIASFRTRLGKIGLVIYLLAPALVVTVESLHSAY